MMTRQRRGAFPLLRWLAVLAMIAVLGVGAMAALNYARPLVSVTTVTQGPVIHAVYATGTIEPRREYPIRSNVAGLIDQVHVDKGVAVKKGDPLAFVADPALKYALDKARAELAEKQGRIAPSLAEFDARILSMEGRLEIAQRELTRAQELLSRNAGSTVDIDRAMDVQKTLWSELESLRSQRSLRELELRREVAVAEAALSTAQWHEDQQTLRAPIDGTVLDRPRSQGTRLAVNDIIMRVADVSPSNLVMRAAVDEEDVTRVRVGQRVIATLYAFPDAHFEGVVSQVYPEADPTRRTFEVDVELGAEAQRVGLQSGMTGELAFVIAAKETARILPSQSVQEGNAVYVLQDGRIARIEPKIGIRAVDRVEILEGLPADAVVVISPVAPAMIGKSARATMIDPRVAAGLNKPTEVSNFKGFGS